MRIYRCKDCGACWPRLAEYKVCLACDGGCYIKLAEPYDEVAGPDEARRLKAHRDFEKYAEEHDRKALEAEADALAMTDVLFAGEVIG